MGYETSFDLDVTAIENLITVHGYDADGKPATIFQKKTVKYTDIIAEIKEIAGYDPFENASKWYDHDSHMREISCKYPEAIFTLHGEGEDSGDIWIKYYKGGKRQTADAKITFDEFDESRLV